MCSNKLLDSDVLLKFFRPEDPSLCWHLTRTHVQSIESYTAYLRYHCVYRIALTFCGSKLLRISRVIRKIISTKILTCVVCLQLCGQYSNVHARWLAWWLCLCTSTVRMDSSRSVSFRFHMERYHHVRYLPLLKLPARSSAAKVRGTPGI